MRLTFALPLVAISLVAAIAWFHGGDVAEVRSENLVPVTVTEARSAIGAEIIETTGILVLKHETVLSFKVGGVIADLGVRAGDVVKVHQILARLNQTEIIAREREVLAGLELARKEHERSTELFRRGIVAARRVEDSRAALQRAQAAYDVVHFDRTWAELRAPWNGIVLDRHAEAGEIVTPGRPIITVGDSDGGFNMMAPVTDRDTGRILVGDGASVTFAAARSSVTGRVARLTAKADVHTGNFEAEIALDASPPSLRSGMIGNAVIHPTGGQAITTLAIPSEAIVEGDGERVSVYVVSTKGNVAELRELSLDRLEGSHAFVSTGIKRGERIIVSGAAYVRPGDKVRVVEQWAELHHATE